MQQHSFPLVTHAQGLSRLFFPHMITTEVTEMLPTQTLSNLCWDSWESCTETRRRAIPLSFLLHKCEVQTSWMFQYGPGIARAISEPRQNLLPYRHHLQVGLSQASFSGEETANVNHIPWFFVNTQLLIQCFTNPDNSHFFLHPLKSELTRLYRSYSWLKRSCSTGKITQWVMEDSWWYRWHDRDGDPSRSNRTIQVIQLSWNNSDNMK